MTDIGETSDGYHTFNELYEHRAMLFIALCFELKRRVYVWRSKLHSDGTMFEGSWFIMGISAVSGEQITYHLPIALWSATDWLGSERPRAPEFDGHTPADVVHRLRRLFA